MHQKGWHEKSNWRWATSKKGGAMPDKQAGSSNVGGDLFAPPRTSPQAGGGGLRRRARRPQVTVKVSSSARRTQNRSALPGWMLQCRFTMFWRGRHHMDPGLAAPPFSLRRSRGVGCGKRRCANTIAGSAHTVALSLIHTTRRGPTNGTGPNGDRTHRDLRPTGPRDQHPTPRRQTRY